MEHDYCGMMHGRSRGLRVLRIISVAFVGVCFAVVFALLFGWVVMLLWNWLMPALFEIKTISYWQAFGITILAKILFSGFHGNHKVHSHADNIHRTVDRRWHRWMGIDDNAPLGDGIGRFSHEDMKRYREFWKTEGEAAFAEFLKKRGSDESSQKRGA